MKDVIACCCYRSCYRKFHVTYGTDIFLDLSWLQFFFNAFFKSSNILLSLLGVSLLLNELAFTKSRASHLMKIDVKVFELSVTDCAARLHEYCNNKYINTDHQHISQYLTLCSLNPYKASIFFNNFKTFWLMWLLALLLNDSSFL